MARRSTGRAPRDGAVLLISLVLVAACGSAATPQSSPSAVPGTPTAEPTETPLALVRTEVSGLLTNGVTYAEVEYSLKDAFVSNQDPRNYAEGGSPEPSESFYT